MLAPTPHPEGTPAAMPAGLLQPSAAMPAHAAEFGSPVAVVPQASECFVCRARRSWLAADAASGGGDQAPWLARGLRVVRRGQVLFHTGDAMRNVYAVHTGQFKTTALAADGKPQVIGFQVGGEMLGLDGIGSGLHTCEAVALEDCQVCSIPYAELVRLMSTMPALKREFWRIMSQQIVHDHELLMWLGTLGAEQRVAAFLLNLLDRLHQLGYSASALVLRMTREEIGSSLGLTLETVSRAFSHFRQQGMLEVHERDIRVLDREALARLSCRA